MRHDVGLQHELVVLGVERLGHFARVHQLVEPVFGEPDRERLDLRPGCLAAIVATTALESMPPLRNAPTGTSLISWSGDGLGEQLAQLLDQLAFG